MSSRQRIGGNVNDEEWIFRPGVFSVERNNRVNNKLTFPDSRADKE